MEDGDELVKVGVVLDEDSGKRDPDISCGHIYKIMSSLLFAKRDGAVDTSDFVEQLMSGAYDGCTSGVSKFPPANDSIRNGARIFVENCASCHTVGPGAGLKVGPNLGDMCQRPVACTASSS